MAVTYITTTSLASANLAIPLVLPALTQMITDLLARLAELTGQINANVALLATLPNPADLAAAIAAAAASALSQIANIITSIPQPLIEANLSFGAKFLALDVFRVQLESILTTLNGALSAGGVHVFKVDSTAAAVGSELAALVSGGINGGLPGARVQGVMLLTESPATAAILPTFFPI